MPQQCRKCLRRHFQAGQLPFQHKESQLVYYLIQQSIVQQKNREYSDSIQYHLSPLFRYDFNHKLILKILLSLLFKAVNLNYCPQDRWYAEQCTPNYVKPGPSQVISPQLHDYSSHETHFPHSFPNNTHKLNPREFVLSPNIKQQFIGQCENQPSNEQIVSQYAVLNSRYEQDRPSNKQYHANNGQYLIDDWELQSHMRIEQNEIGNQKAEGAQSESDSTNIFIGCGDIILWQSQHGSEQEVGRTNDVGSAGIESSPGP